MEETEQIKYVGLTLKKAREGDSASAEILYKELYTPIFRYAYRRVKRREDAEDIAQTVFMKLLAATDTPESISIAYVYQTARNALIDLWRKEGRGMLYDDEIIEREANTVTTEEDNGDAKRAVETLLGHLSGEQREAIELRYLREFSIKEIAETMQKSEEAVRQILSRATRKLKDGFDFEEIENI
jgi:RNA polymerase sigma-70 factor (ECF subfamily)